MSTYQIMITCIQQKLQLYSQSHRTGFCTKTIQQHAPQLTQQCLSTIVNLLPIMLSSSHLLSYSSDILAM